MRILPLLAYICLSVTPHPVLAGETAVEPSDNGVDMLQDSTDDGDARSSETSAAAENLVDAVPAHEHDVPTMYRWRTPSPPQKVLPNRCSCWVLK
jgi:hypothetical protein